MTKTEILRLAIVLVCGSNLGLTTALFELVGKHFVPRRGMRALMLGFMIVLGFLITGSIAKFHQPPTWVAYGVLAGMTVILCGLASVFGWYRSPVGHRHSAAMLASVARER